MRAEARGSFRTDPWPHSVDASAAPTPADGSSTPDSPFVLPPKLPPGVTPTPPSPGALPPGTPRVESSAPLRVNGAAVFPRMVWRQCPTYYPTSIAAGINLFLGVSCDDEQEQLTRLAGRAMSTVDAATPGIGGPGLVGWHLPDEADVSVGDPEKLPVPKENGQGHVPDSHRPLLRRRRARAVRQGHLPRLLRARRHHRLRHLSGRGALLARPDRQRLLDAA